MPSDANIQGQLAKQLVRDTIPNLFANFMTSNVTNCWCQLTKHFFLISKPG